VARHQPAYADRPVSGCRGKVSVAPSVRQHGRHYRHFVIGNAGEPFYSTVDSTPLLPPDPPAGRPLSPNGGQRQHGVVWAQTFFNEEIYQTISPIKRLPRIVAAISERGECSVVATKIDSATISKVGNTILGSKLEPLSEVGRCLRKFT
jgi:hypothetical protein